MTSDYHFENGQPFIEPRKEMADRLAIASKIATGLFSGLPFSWEDFDENPKLKQEEEKVMKAVAQFSMRMADALIKENASVYDPTLSQRFEFMGLDSTQLRRIVDFYRNKTGDVELKNVPIGMAQKTEA